MNGWDAMPVGPMQQVDPQQQVVEALLRRAIPMPTIQSPKQPTAPMPVMKPLFRPQTVPLDLEEIMLLMQRGGPTL